MPWLPVNACLWRCFEFLQKPRPNLANMLEGTARGRRACRRSRNEIVNL
jgi:hypothetical protein